jgi:nitrogenase molybdenum-iron protein NifN
MPESAYVSTTNACKLCTPLGASLAFKGIENCVPFLHGSQGCATYMRRYVISHFREPMDIASSALGEKQAVFGGGPNLKKGLLNVMKKYGADVIGVATTCLTETIGDDVPAILHEFRREFSDLPLPAILHASTPSYSGTHADGWTAAVRAAVEGLCGEAPAPRTDGSPACADASRATAPGAPAVNLLPGLMSCEDVRRLKELCRICGVSATVLPDISESLDGPAQEDYLPIPPGGTPLAAIRTMPAAGLSLELGRTLCGQATAAGYLDERFSVPRKTLGLPIGIRETDALVAALCLASGRDTPRELALARGRLVDAMVDGHKYVSGKRAVVYGEEDFVVALCSFLGEIGVQPVLAATGARGKGVREAVETVCEGLTRSVPTVVEGADFFDIAEQAKGMEPDLLIGHSKGYQHSREWNIPLVRAGFPIHDRFGGQRLLHVGYQGALALYDRIVNAILEKNQSESPVGYGYL